MSRSEKALLVVSGLIVGLAVGGVLVGSSGHAQYGTPPTYQSQLPVFTAKYTAEDPTIKDVMSKLDALEKKLDKIMEMAEPDPAQQQVGVVKDPIVTAVQKCATCHQEGSGKKNGGFVMFDKSGDPTKLSRADTVEIVNQVKAGTMPKAPVVLTPDERNAIIRAYSQQRK